MEGRVLTGSSWQSRRASRDLAGEVKITFFRRWKQVLGEGSDLSRRELLTMILPRYGVIPYIDDERCVYSQNCLLCKDICPSNAIIFEEHKIAINKAVCKGCGACVFYCPQRAVIYPTFSPEQLDEEMEGLLSSENTSPKPKIVAIVCRSCSPIFDREGSDHLHFPANVLPLKVPCLAMASPWLILRAFDRGAQGIALIYCREDCQLGFEPTKWNGDIRFIQGLFECWDIESSRLKLFSVLKDKRDSFKEDVDRFAQEIAKLPPTPLTKSEAALLPDNGMLLPLLIGDLDIKLKCFARRRVSQGTIPFGKVEVDSFKCTGCSLCATVCPTDALRISKSEKKDTYQLTFQHDICVACGYCVESCPENCLRLERVLELDRINRPASVIFEDKAVRCRRCGIPFSFQAMVNNLKAKISASGGPTWQFDLCPSCRTEIQFEEEEFTISTQQINKHLEG